MPRIRPSALLLLALSVSALVPRAAATQARSLDPGDEVRVLAPSVRPAPILGRVVSYTTDGLVVREAGTRATQAIPITAIRELARNRGLSRVRSGWRAARVGGWTGFALGAVAGPLIAADQRDSRMVRSGIIYAAAGTLLGAGAGGAVGAVLATEHWQVFRIADGPRVAVTGGARGAVVLEASLPVRW